MNVSTRKVLLLCIFFGTLLSSLLYLDYAKLSGTAVDLLAFFARFSAFVGTWLLFWNYLLGIRSIVGKWIVDLAWLVNIHKKTGKWTLYTLVLHFGLISIYYFQKYQINLVQVSSGDLRGFYKDVGFVALGIIALIAVTSIWLRKRFSFRGWHNLHLLSYVVLPIALVHTIGIGREDLPLIGRYLWITLAIIYMILLIYQLLSSMGMFKYKYKILSEDSETPTVSNIVLVPEGKNMLHPMPGQFIYIQPEKTGESHPFGVINYEPLTGKIWIAPKRLGTFTEWLSTKGTNQRIFIDGPYGVFTSEFIKDPNMQAVFIAGGIGIAPFMYSLYLLKKGIERPITLIYGNNTEDDIPFRDELAELAREVSNLKVVHVIRDAVNPGFEKGFVTIDVIKKYLGDDLTKYDFFICGPPVMINLVDKALRESGHVSKKSIHYELFSF